MTMAASSGDAAPFDAGQRKVLEQIASGAALADVLEQIVWLVERQAAGMACSILLVDPERRCIRHGAAPSLPPELTRAIDGAAIGPDAGSCGAAAHRGERVIVDDIATHPNWTAYKHLALPHGLRACWSTPIFSAGREVLGTFAMYYREPRRPEADEVSWVDAATHLAAIAIDHEAAARALRESEARHRETAERMQQLARLYAVSSSVNVAIVRVRDPQELYAQACRIAVEQGRLRLAWVGLHDPERRAIVPVARFGRDDGYIDRITLGLDDRTGGGPAGQALTTARTAVVDDIASATDFYWKSEALARGLRGCAAFPLTGAGRPIGVLLLYADRAGFFGVEELGVLESLADDISFALDFAASEAERRRLVEALRERVKELTLLHRMTSLLQGDRPCDAAFLAELVAPIPLAWQHPDVCEARIAWGELEARTAGWRDTPWRQSATFAGGGIHGIIEVAYLAERPGAVEGPFLAEERALLQTVADMTGVHLERQRTQAHLRQSQRLQSLGTLAGGIAHDFNNVLTAIGANAELAALRLPADHAVRRNMDGIRQATSRAADLVRRILTFSRQGESRRAIVALPSVVDEVLKLLRATLPGTIDIRTRCEPDAASVLADATQIHQIVMNLGTNAAHAMAEGGGTLDVHVVTVTLGPEAAAISTDLREGAYVRLSVADTGCGMSRATLERIFEPFFTTKGPGQGTGLGLSVVHGIMKSHEGAITVESEVGRGTTFHLYFPAADPDAADAAPRPATEVRGQGERVLYVDDEEAVVDVATRTLEGLGYRVTGSTRATEALERFRSAPRAFDVVVTDLTLPELPGLDLARRLREIRPDVALVVTSGYVRPDAADAVHRLDGVEIVLKPNVVTDLGAAVKRALDRSRATHS